MIGEYARMLRLFHRDARLYLATSALFGFTMFGGIYPVLLNLYLLRMKYGPEFIGLLNASGALAAAVFCLLAGAWGARWGSRSVMIAGSALMSVGNCLIPMANAVPDAWQSGWLLAMNVVGNLGVALYVTNTGPFLMSVSGPAERNHVFSVQSALGPLAAFAGSLIGGFMPGWFALLLHSSLDQPDPYRYPLIFAALMLIPSVLLLAATREGRKAPTPAGAGVKAVAPYGLIVLLTLVILLQVAGEGVARMFFNVYLDSALGLPAAQIGVLAAFGQLLAVPAALLTPVLMARWGNDRTYIVSTLGLSVCLLPLALIPQWGAAGLGFMGVMMVAATARTAVSVLGMLVVAPAWRAMIAGATSMAVGLSWGAMGLAGGYVITTLGYPSLFGMGALLTAAGAILFWAYFRTQPAQQAHNTSV